MLKIAILRAAALLLVFTSTFPGAAVNDELVVIVNRANPTEKLSKGELRGIFLTTKTRWADGSQVLAVNLPESNELRQWFDRTVIGMDRADIARYWMDRRIRGETRGPRSISSSLAVAKIVTESVGAVGYVHRSEAGETVKVVAVIQDNVVRGP